ncbi:hypothetical protein HYS48_04160 [Candidatus Woesearchaeota archaeon]|nr:hypothetical protein [Candidatus Woesearchaeota archaeon]
MNNAAQTAEVSQELPGTVESERNLSGMECREFKKGLTLENLPCPIKFLKKFNQNDRGTFASLQYHNAISFYYLP